MHKRYFQVILAMLGRFCCYNGNIKLRSMFNMVYLASLISYFLRFVGSLYFYAESIWVNSVLTF